MSGVGGDFALTDNPKHIHGNSSLVRVNCWLGWVVCHQIIFEVEKLIIHNKHVFQWNCVTLHLADRTQSAMSSTTFPPALVSLDTP